MTINIASSQIIIVPEEAHHCVHQHWAMGSLPFPSPIRHQGQFQGAGHKAWIMGHLVDVSRQTPSGLCIWDLFSSELRGQIQVQLAVNRNMNFRIIFLLQLILFLWTIACDLSSKTKLFEYFNNENYFLHGIWQSSIIWLYTEQLAMTSFDQFAGLQTKTTEFQIQHNHQLAKQLNSEYIWNPNNFSLTFLFVI